jgi:hypothetical protein
VWPAVEQQVTAEGEDAMRGAFLVAAGGLCGVLPVLCGCPTESFEFPGGQHGDGLLRWVAEGRVHNEYPDADLFWIIGYAGDEGAMPPPTWSDGCFTSTSPLTSGDRSTS